VTIAGIDYFFSNLNAWVQALRIFLDFIEALFLLPGFWFFATRSFQAVPKRP
jgi:hypothetical protein